jgi:hypothetical protein
MSTLRVHTNGGTQYSSQMGTVTNFCDVWFNDRLLANILSVAAVRKVCRITMDTSVKAAMHVHRKDGTVMTFKDYRSGLYCYNAGPKHSKTSDAHLFLNRVAENKETYTRRESEGANRARALYKKIGRPSEREFTDILQNKLIQNYPVTSDDVKRALSIYGPIMHLSKERQSRNKIGASQTTKQHRYRRPSLHSTTTFACS